MHSTTKSIPAISCTNSEVVAPTAFPSFKQLFIDTRFASGHELFLRCYQLRTFERFMVWFALVESGEASSKSKIDMPYKASSLVEKIFSFDF